MLGEYCPKTDVWNKHWLMDEYNEKVINKVILQGWAIDEMIAFDMNIDAFVEELWKDYPLWAENYLEDAKRSQYE